MKYHLVCQDNKDIVAYICALLLPENHGHDNRIRTVKSHTVLQCVVRMDCMVTLGKTNKCSMVIKMEVCVYECFVEILLYSFNISIRYLKFNNVVNFK